MVLGSLFGGLAVGLLLLLKSLGSFGVVFGLLLGSLFLRLLRIVLLLADTGFGGALLAFLASCFAGLGKALLALGIGFRVLMGPGIVGMVAAIHAELLAGALGPC